MTTLAQSSVAIAPAPLALPGAQHLVLYDLAWENYLSIGRLLADRPALRLTYDRGTLEFLTTSTKHERFKHWLGRFLETIAEELHLAIMPGGSMTFQREDLDRGFEPDNCYWIANEATVREKLTWEPAHDPPSDLMIEIEVSRSALSRMAIFAAFRIPEIWCFDGQDLRVNLLQADGAYLPGDRSLAFPSIDVKELARFLPPANNSEYLKAVAEVRAWVRARISQAR